MNDSGCPRSASWPHVFLASTARTTAVKRDYKQDEEKVPEFAKMLSRLAQI